MKVLILTIILLLTGFAGWRIYTGRVSPDLPVDFTGRTSIIIELETGDWCELRGPARFYVLDHFAEPDRAVRNGDFVRSAEGMGTAGYAGSP